MVSDELKKRLKKLHNNLNVLEERKAKYGVDVPLSLLNQIEDHRRAIDLVEQALRNEISEEELADELAPLNLELGGNVQNIFQTIQTLPRFYLISGVVIGIAIVLVMLLSTFLDIPLIQALVSPTETPTPTATLTPTITPTPTATPFAQIAEPGQKLILVSQFNSEVGGELYKVGQNIYNDLDEKIHETELQNVRLAPIPEALTPEFSDQARALGQAYSSTLVIWGIVDSTGIRARFSVIDSARDDLVGISSLKKLRDPLNLTDFNLFLQDELPKQVTFLTTSAIGQLYLKEQDFQEAGRIFELLLQDFPRSIPDETLANIYFFQGLVAQNLNDLSAALSGYDQALALDASLYQAHYNRGIVHQDLRMFEESLEDFSNAIAANDQLPGAYSMRGLSYAIQKQDSEAMADFNAALELDPTNIGALLNRAVVYKRAGAFDEALADYDKILIVDPTLSPAYQGRARVYRELKNYEQAIADYERILEFDPQDEYQIRFDTLVSIGWVYYLMEDYQKAIETNQTNLETYAHLEPDDPGFSQTVFMRYNLALALLANGQPELADVEYERALSLTQKPEIVEKVIADIEDLLVQQPDTAGAAEMIEKLRSYQ